MAKLFVYDAFNNRFYTYDLNENDPMPYSYGSTLKLREFRGSSGANVLWTTTAAMEAWNLTRRTSQHYAGVAFDVGQRLTSAQRRRIWQVATNLGVWGYVEPLSMTPTWVHFDRRYGKPACAKTTAGYPTVRRGNRSTYVLVLQDALNALGYTTGTLDGVFGARTETALKGVQRRFGLTADGVCGCNSWKKITEAVVGIGRTSTVIDK